MEPKIVHEYDNANYFYYFNRLYAKLISVYKFKNLPETFDEDYLLDNLFRVGYLAAFEKDGVPYLLQCGITGYNAYKKPTSIICSNPVFEETVNKTIGIDCELLYFNLINGAFLPANELISKYARLLAECDASLSTTLINSRVAHLFIAETDAEANTYKKIYDEVTKGNPAVFTVKRKTALSEDFTRHIMINNVKNTFVGQELLNVKRTIMNEFLTEIGINNISTQKSENLIIDEVNANNNEIKSIAQLWLDTMQRCCEKINALLGTNMEVEFNEPVGFDSMVSGDEEESELDIRERDDS